MTPHLAANSREVVAALGAMEWIGLTSRWAESLALLGDLLGISGSLQNFRLAETPYPYHEFDQAQLEGVMQMNSTRLGVQIYASASRVFEARVAAAQAADKALASRAHRLAKSQRRVTGPFVHTSLAALLDPVKSVECGRLFQPRG